MMNPNYYGKRSPRKFGMGLLMPAIAALLLGGIVMWLWNAILPELLKVNFIAYWQAVGLLVLCKILFGNFRAGGPAFRGKHSGPSNFWKEKLMNMTDEERSAMKEEWKKRCERRRS